MQGDGLSRLRIRSAAFMRKKKKEIIRYKYSISSVSSLDTWRERRFIISLRFAKFVVTFQFLAFPDVRASIDLRRKRGVNIISSMHHVCDMKFSIFKGEHT
jgi:hypothetical protein